MKIKEYWNSRAKLGDSAGTQDLIARQLEVREIKNHIHDGQKILDVGCGNGLTANEISNQFNVEIIGIDFSPKMIEEAKILNSNIEFHPADILHWKPTNLFDVIYTQRTLINLPDWNTQQKAMKNIGDLLTSMGKFLMIENSQDGLNNLNKLRRNVGLLDIKPPWHNRYFIDSEIEKVSFLVLERVVDFSSTYYFLSRVINAALHDPPEYDHPINQCALKLPIIRMGCGQTRLWIWRKQGRLESLKSDEEMSNQFWEQYIDEVKSIDSHELYIKNRESY